MHAVNRDFADTIATNQFRKLVSRVDKILNASTLVSRRANSTSADKRRDIYEDCGYKQTQEITPSDYQGIYERNPIAKKVVELYPKHCWRITPSVYEDEDPEVTTPFEESFTECVNRLSGESWYGGSEGNQLFEQLCNVSILANIGHYGVLLFGLSGEEGKDLSQPIDLAKPGTKAKRRELLYLKGFAESQAQINDYDTDSSSPRYRLPTSYNLTFDDSTFMKVSADSPSMPVADSVNVHWSRVLHVAPNSLNTAVFHAPACRPYWNRLQDLDKLYGGSAEMYWQGAFPGLFFGTHPQLGGDVTINASDMKDMLEQYSNSLQRWLMMVGMDAKTLAPQVVDPTPQINAQIEAICIGEDCPKRVFIGSERGELASSQDAKSWNEAMVQYRNARATPKLLVPCINRLIQYGVLVPPQEYFYVEWPEMEKMTEDEKANRALKLSQAIVAFIAGGGEQYMPLDMFLTMILGFSLEEARSIMEELESDEYKEHMLEKQMEEEAARAEAEAATQRNLPNIPEEPEGI